MDLGIVLLDVVIVLVAAKLAGAAVQRIGQPPVLGELLAGVLLGLAAAWQWLPLPDLAGAAHDEAATILGFLAEFGAILLLFQVGLESDLKGLRAVGRSSAWVALIGMAASFVGGYAASWAVARYWPPWHAASTALPPSLLHVFVGATLTATSVGITARVLADMHRARSPEARIILGAAVLDDIGGLLVLAVVAGMVGAAGHGTALNLVAVARIAAVAVGFLVAALAVGLLVVPRLFDAVAQRARLPGMSLSLAVAFALLLSYGAQAAGLATIVGAFAAGLILAPSRHAKDLRHSVEAMAALFVGFFFVTLGMRVDLTQMQGNAAAAIAIAVALAAVAIAAKLACGWGVVRGQANRLVVGVGMAPRGEVGLIFAAIGSQPLGGQPGLLAPWQYTCIVLVVLVTTFITPLWLHRLDAAFTGPPEPRAPALAPVGDMP